MNKVVLINETTFLFMWKHKQILHDGNVYRMANNGAKVIVDNTLSDNEYKLLEHNITNQFRGNTND